MVNENLTELITRAVASAVAPVDAQLKALHTEIIAMKNADEADGLGRHLTSRHTLNTGGRTDCAAVVAEGSAKESSPATCIEGKNLVWCLSYTYLT